VISVFVNTPLGLYYGEPFERQRSTRDEEFAVSLSCYAATIDSRSRARSNAPNAMMAVTDSRARTVTA
jgi:hypothetical protein